MYDFGIKKGDIWFITDCPQKAIIAEKYPRYVGVNVICTDFLKWSPNMKFDCVIGNPPYQAPKERKNPNSKSGSCGKRLWPDFVIKSMSLVKENGYISLIHPSLWRKPENELFQEFKSRDLQYLEFHSISDGIKIFNASTAYDWYIVKNAKYNGDTIIKDVNGKIFKVDISNLNCIPSADFDLFQKLIAKDGEERCNVIYSRSSYGSDKKWMTKEESEQFKYPCVYMNTKEKGIQFWYSRINTNGHFGTKKVIISENGGFLGTYNDFKGKYGLTQFMFGLVIDSKDEGDLIIKAIESESFKKIWNSTQWMSNHREWRVFKYFKKDFWKKFI